MKDDVPEINMIPVDSADSSEFEAHTENFERHFRAFYAGQGYGYEFFQPAYRFGFETAMANDYTGDDWSEQEGNLADSSKLNGQICTSTSLYR